MRTSIRLFTSGSQILHRVVLMYITPQHFTSRRNILLMRARNTPTPKSVFFLQCPSNDLENSRSSYRRCTEHVEKNMLAIKAPPSKAVTNANGYYCNDLKKQSWSSMHGRMSRLFEGRDLGFEGVGRYVGKVGRRALSQNGGSWTWT